MAKANNTRPLKLARGVAAEAIADESRKAWAAVDLLPIMSERLGGMASRLREANALLDLLSCAAEPAGENDILPAIRQVDEATLWVLLNSLKQIVSDAAVEVDEKATIARTVWRNVTGGK